MATIARIKDINGRTDRWKIECRVLRRWNVYTKNAPDQLLAYSFLLLDKHGDKIQATVFGSKLHQKFVNYPKEGGTYFIANFVASPNNNIQYKPTNHPYKITITNITFIKEEAFDIPQYSYSFKSLPDLKKANDTKDIDYLFDVMAYVKTLGNLEEYPNENGAKNKLLLTLIDNDDMEMDCILYDQCAVDAFSTYLAITQKPVVILINLARLGISRDGTPHVSSSFHATKVLFNPDIKEVQDFIHCGRVRDSPTFNLLSQHMPLSQSQPSSSCVGRGDDRISISEISTIRAGVPFSIACQIDKFESRHGWIYDGCGKCSTKLSDDGNIIKSTNMSKNFYSNIRQYNNMFSFTSMGGKISHQELPSRGPFSFVLSGMNYHNIGSLMPPSGGNPVFSQLYIYDTEHEIANRVTAVSKHQKAEQFDPLVIELIKSALDEYNPYVKQYRYASSILRENDAIDLKLCLISSRSQDGRTYNLPTASEVAALVVGDIDMTFNVRDVIVEKRCGQIKRISELHPSYLPLQYPLLFPFGEDGYRDDIDFNEQSSSTTSKRKRVSMREYFAYRLMNRKNDESVLLHSEKLLQQFIVDAYTMIEAQRLLWIRTYQKELRVDLYQGLSDAVLRGETNAASTGRRIVLPSSFTGGPRYMILNYQDAMAICKVHGYPDIFVTFTCNPAWPEITRYSSLFKTHPSCKPDVISRVFRMKLLRLMKYIKKKKVFGTVQAEVYTVEFQKRGLPHAHILLFLKQNEKITTVEQIDKIISAELPDRQNNPRLFGLVNKFMMHSPCGSSNKKAPCMKNNKCSKHFPKRFNDYTIVDEEGFPTYRRRDDGKVVEVKGVQLDNRFVVPYNEILLQKFEAHINVEKCNQSTAIKYLFKYISKGNDRVVAGFFENSSNRFVDEIQHYCNCRYISACEATWRIMGFEIHHRYPHVERLSFHLPNQQHVIYSSVDDISDLLDKPRVSESQFLAWMKINDADPEARKWTYQEFPNHYVYQRSKRTWKRREKGGAIGRITHVSPSAGELYYLRMLLTKVKGPRSFDEIKTVDGITYSTFREACGAYGLLDDDCEFITGIKEASIWSSGYTLRKLFVTMLLCACLDRPDNVWGQCKTYLSEDLLYVSRNNPEYSNVFITPEMKEQAALREIDSLLIHNGKCLKDFPSLPLPSDTPDLDVSNNLILQELSYDRAQMKMQADDQIQKMNSDQRRIFDHVMTRVENCRGGFIFVYGHGGTGKTFLWNTLSSAIRASGEIVLTVASSGIAATLLPSGRTAHSRFAIPIDINEFSMCSVKQNSPLANLIKCTKLIIWDEAPMVQKHCIEAFDRTLRDIMQCASPFGGKCVLMGGDFRQILPVIPKGTRADIVNSCITSSYLWCHVTIFKLSINMRLTGGNMTTEDIKLQQFSKWLLDIGDGNIGNTNDVASDVEIPSNLLIEDSNKPLEQMVKSTYNDLLSNLSNNEYFNDKAILAPTIEIVNKLNMYALSMLPGDSIDYFSYDSVCKASEDIDTFENLYSTEYLNSINSSGLPPHKLTLKVGAPVMLLRNIDQASGLCNGTRLRITHLGKSVIQAITLNGSHPNEKVVIHRMDMNPSDTKWPFKMKRRQFPLSLSFAMTINKSQGQSLKKVGIYLDKPVFAHGQLYVALSRVRSIDGLKIYVPFNGDKGRRTTANVVYKEIFSKLQVSE